MLGSLILLAMITPDTLAARSNEFGVKLFQQLHSTTGNVMVSPYSLYSCLEGLVPGAAGNTLATVTNALGAPGMPVDQFLGEGRPTTERFAKQDSGVLVANAVWTRPGLTLSPDYLDATQKYLGMRATSLANLGKNGVDQINNWVSENTKKRIPTLVSDLDPYTQVVLTNAVCFDGTWVHAFPSPLTKNLPFQTSGGSKDVPTMTQQEIMGYAEVGQTKLLRLGYKEGESMWIALPPAGATPSQSLGALVSVPPTRRSQVDLRLPKFSFSDSHELKDPLSNMGLAPVFHNADFTKMHPSLTFEKTCVSDVIQKTWINVDEHGTQAAAATGVFIRSASAVEGPVVRFYVDHPFAFTIRDDATGTILFMGIVRDPLA